MRYRHQPAELLRLGCFSRLQSVSKLLCGRVEQPDRRPGQVYVGHMLDLVGKVVAKTEQITREEFDRTRISASPWRTCSRPSARLRGACHASSRRSIPRYPGPRSSGCATRSCTTTWESTRTSSGEPPARKCRAPALSFSNWSAVEPLSRLCARERRGGTRPLTDEEAARRALSLWSRGLPKNLNTSFFQNREWSGPWPVRRMQLRGLAVLRLRCHRPRRARRRRALLAPLTHDFPQRCTVRPSFPGGPP